MQNIQKIEIPSRLEKFTWPTRFKTEFESRGLNLFIKRDDLIHPEVSGNKWRKLKYNIAQAKSLKKEGILTFGGAYSNHLLATAAACHLEGMKSMGLVRGEELQADSNKILKRCAELGMNLNFISRAEYTERDNYDYLTNVKSEFKNFYCVPEGGKNFFGIIGCQEIVNELGTHQYDDLWLAQGTSATSLGILTVLPENKKLHLVPSIKNFDSKAEMKNLLFGLMDESDFDEKYAEQVVRHDQYNFGGYAKTTEELEEFKREMEAELHLKLDSVYTTKCFFGLCDYYLKNKNIKARKIIFLHTGGIF
jgi:1-aminocyclopropane-1-carboxylate deaminase